MKNDALKFTSCMKLGWNLGNTLDACNGKLADHMQIESAWCGIKTTREMIDTIRNAGFNTLRIPISWHNHLVGGTFEIKQEWLSRVKEVVDYAYDAGMYVIINIHHDNEENFYYPIPERLENSKIYIRDIWSQICAKFGNYGERLVFESINEPRMKGCEYEWHIDASVKECLDAIECINQLNQIFVDTVRASGMNNSERYLMVPGYDASPAGAMIDSFKIPKDTVNNHIIVSVHAYTPYNFALMPPSDEKSVNVFDPDDEKSTGEIDRFMSGLFNKFIFAGVPVVIGEFGARDKGKNTASRIKFAKYYTSAAASRGIPCVWWDNHEFEGNGELFGLLDRKNLRLPYPEIVKALADGAVFN